MTQTFYKLIKFNSNNGEHLYFSSPSSCEPLEKIDLTMPYESDYFSYYPLASATNEEYGIIYKCIDFEPLAIEEQYKPEVSIFGVTNTYDNTCGIGCVVG